MFRYIYAKNRKKHQRAVNRAIRTINKLIEKDSLWRGRFFIYQRQAIYYEFEDGSGAEMLFLLEFVDKATGYRALAIADTNEVINHSGWAMNRFITGYADAWNIKPDPYLDFIDYQKLKNNNYMLNYIKRDLPFFRFYH